MIYPTLKECGLPHTVVEWYVCHEHESLLKEYGLPHTVVEWYVRREHESLLKEYGLPHNVAEWYVRREHQTRSFTKCFACGIVYCDVWNAG